MLATTAPGLTTWPALKRPIPALAISLGLADQQRRHSVTRTSRVSGSGGRGGQRRAEERSRERWRREAKRGRTEERRKGEHVWRTGEGEDGEKERERMGKRMGKGKGGGKRREEGEGGVTAPLRHAGVLAGIRTQAWPVAGTGGFVIHQFGILHFQVRAADLHGHGRRARRAQDCLPYPDAVG